MTAELPRFRELIAKAATGAALTSDEARDAFDLMMTGNATPAQIAGLLMALRVHLCFSVPAAVLLPVMLYTGLTHRRSLHLVLAVLFAILWLGTFVTGVFYLPHTAP